VAALWLLRQGADINATDKRKMTPLHNAVAAGMESTVELLLTYGADSGLKADAGTADDLARKLKLLNLAMTIEDVKAHGPARYHSLDAVEALMDDHEDRRSRALSGSLRSSNAASSQWIPGPIQWVVVKHGLLHKYYKLDFGCPVSDWMDFLGSILKIPMINEYLLLLVPSSMNAVALEREDSVLDQLAVGSLEALPYPSLHFELRRRRLLVDTGLAVVRDMYPLLMSADYDTVAKPLVVVFTASGRALHLLQWSIATEMANVPAVQARQLLFREDSLCSKMVMVYFQLMGSSYLSEILSPVVHHIINSKTSYEVDPNRADYNKKNVKKIKEILDMTFDAIVKSRPAVPRPIRDLCVELAEVTGLRYPDLALTAVCGFLFLRFLCPALTSPVKFNILDESPPAEALRALVITAKVLQALANGVLFGDKEAYLMEFNDWVSKRTGPFRTYVEGLVAKHSAEHSAAPPLCLRISDPQELDAANRIESLLKDRKPELLVFNPRLLRSSGNLPEISSPLRGHSGSTPMPLLPQAVLPNRGPSALSRKDMVSVSGRGLARMQSLDVPSPHHHNVSSSQSSSLSAGAALSPHAPVPPSPHSLSGSYHRGGGRGSSAGAKAGRAQALRTAAPAAAAAPSPAHSL
jgi:hypothetical protein